MNKSLIEYFKNWDNKPFILEIGNNAYKIYKSGTKRIYYNLRNESYHYRTKELTHLCDEIERLAC